MNSHILRVLLLSPVFSLLTMAQSLEGIWQGNVTLPKAPESRAAIRVTRTDGSLAGVMFLLDTKVQLPVANISLQGATAKMSIAGMIYEGTLSADGNLPRFYKLTIGSQLRACATQARHSGDSLGVAETARDPRERCAAGIRGRHHQTLSPHQHPFGNLWHRGWQLQGPRSFADLPADLRL